MSLTAGVPGKVPVLILIGMKEDGPFIGFGDELGAASEVLLILAKAPCTHACICVLLVEFAEPF